MMRIYFIRMLKDNEKSSNERTIYSVSEITNQIKNTIESSFTDIWVKGEISNLRRAASGHSYFTIKDANAVLNAVIFRGNLSNIHAELKDGTKAVFLGKISLYAQRGSYQLIIRYAEETGKGALFVAFEKLKKKLLAEGLFEQSRKKEIPFMPERVGVVTSPTGAALQDILRVSKKRFPGIDLIIYPSLVQGDAAAPEIVKAIKQADADQLCDVLIIARGGGSLEDLWPFNEEIVARAVAECSIPTVSGVGHEIDFTITDFVADKRTPTPSAAAETVFPDKKRISEALESYTSRFSFYIKKIISHAQERLEQLSQERLRQRVVSLLEKQQMRLDDSQERVRANFKFFLAQARSKWVKSTTKLNALDPHGPFRRGFSIIRKNNKIICDSNALSPSDSVQIEFQHGSAEAEISSIKTES